MSDPSPTGAMRRWTLEILGLADMPVAVFALAQRPSLLIFDGCLPASGRLRLRVPRGGALRVLVGTHEAVVDFTNGAPVQCVDART